MRNKLIQHIISISRQCIHGSIVAISILLLFSNSCSAQSIVAKDPAHSKIHLSYIYGNQKGLDLDYVYRIKSIQLQYTRSLTRNKRFNLEILGKLQYSKSEYLPTLLSSTFENGYEVGFNGGIKLDINLYNYLFVQYVSVSSGPQYISSVPERQTEGFNMISDVFTGTEIRLVNNLYLNLHIGVRHLSNVDIKKPNGGINNLLLGIGFAIHI